MKNISTLTESFWHTVAAYGHRAALSIDDYTYSYNDLANNASKLYQGLCSLKNVSPIVAVIGEKNITAYAGILAVLSSGKAYCPLGIKFPPLRNRNIIEQAGCNAIICSNHSVPLIEPLLRIIKEEKVILSIGEVEDEYQKALPQHRFIDVSGCSPGDYPYHAKPDDYAYLIFTSGSTGKPKGVPIRHRNVMAYVNNISAIASFSCEDRMSQVPPLTFDFSVHDLYVCWHHGASLYPVPEKMMMSPAQFIKDKELTVWVSVPSQIALLQKFGLLKPGNFPSVRTSLFCGEPLFVDLIKDWEKAAPNTRIFNIYGPTEATVAISHYEWKRDGKETDNKHVNNIVSVGHIFDDQHYMLDGEDTAEGEIWLSGSQVTDCYWKDIEKTKESFRLSSKGGNTWYKTGDMMRVDEEGFLYFISRVDHQVKIKGFRVELEEITSVVKEITNESMVCSIAVEKGMEKAVITFIATDRPVDTKAIIESCKEKLPYYMTPDEIIVVESMPLNQNGKIDRHALQNLQYS